MDRPRVVASIAMKPRSGDNRTETNGEILLGRSAGLGLFPRQAR